VPEPRPELPADPDHPSAARVYEYLTGGTDYFAADAELAGQMMDPDRGGHPGLRELARENRRFVLSAVRWSAAMLGISQFLDVGCGLPSFPMVHDAARSAVPPSRVAYADKDPGVVRHLQCVQAEGGWQGTTVLEADARDPAAVLAAPALLEVIDLREPVALILGGTLSAMTAGEARDAVAGYAERMVPGSAVIISCASYRDQGLGERMAAMFAAAGGWHNHGPADVESFFAAGHLRLVQGRVMDVCRWPMIPAGGAADAVVLGGVGIRD